MIEQTAGCRIKVEALDEAYQALAEQWAERLGLSLDEPDAEFALQLSAQGLQLQQLGADAPGPVRVDFIRLASLTKFSGSGTTSIFCLVTFSIPFRYARSSSAQ